VVEGQRAVAQGTTSYTNGYFYWNLWTMRFDEENRCAEFVEWFMVRPLLTASKKGPCAPRRPCGGQHSRCRAHLR
jgi:hypothetical protein